MKRYFLLIYSGDIDDDRFLDEFKQIDLKNCFKS